ncbi:hypothetical protein QQF64_021503 [Cirrhinus molitorella]|uniref:Uncharacterized protein n=1 Tax=Cirrhinus molitorella TaxID=172907 RepID=A0ABR3L728_9TELE
MHINDTRRREREVRTSDRWVETHTHTHSAQRKSSSVSVRVVSSRSPPDVFLSVLDFSGELRGTSAVLNPNRTSWRTPTRSQTQIGDPLCFCGFLEFAQDLIDAVSWISWRSVLLSFGRLASFGGS